MQYWDMLTMSSVWRSSLILGFAACYLMWGEFPTLNVYY